MNSTRGGAAAAPASWTPAQRARGAQLAELYKQGDTVDPLASALMSVGQLAHRVTKATGTQRPARALAHALERPGYVALKSAQTLHKVNQDWENIGRTAPRGWYEMGNAVVQDVKAAHSMPPEEARRQLSLLLAEGPAAVPGLLPHTSAIAKQVGMSTLGDIRHPLRHPGYTALDALLATSGGVALGSRAAAAGRAFGAAGEAPLTGAASFVADAAPARVGLVPSLRRAATTYVKEPLPKRTFGLGAARAGARADVRFRQSQSQAQTPAAVAPFGGPR